MSKRPVDVRENLTPEEFIHEYIEKNRPVIVTGAMKNWRAPSTWTPESFRELFGDMPVEVTADGPVVLEKMPFSAFYEHLKAASEGPGEPDGSIDKLRYMRMRELESLEKVNGDWARPGFMPEGGYVIPFAPFGMDPTRKRFPGFGLFISPKGAASKLHVDGIRSNAIVCQVYGSKRCFMFAPDQEALLPDQESRRARKLKRLDYERPDFGKAKMVEFDVNPGEIVFVPRQWFHEVHTLNTSISLTYNFVHGCEALGFASWFLRTSITNPASHNVG
ncbi:cupin-like domain-containing protein [Archangium violaceum]|uniref:cupin-like domain-containing protein n=1 Tax=Archangium violaceum TaxID=83451 RepID=UPI00195080F4|nr:cupin-like domain-containing protein [Archangium violaceum]QRO01489.1 cupin-like domain-containing protein [Archangium violaceum]